MDIVTAHASALASALALYLWADLLLLDSLQAAELMHVY